jgi:hypothetical protein
VTTPTGRAVGGPGDAIGLSAYRGVRVLYTSTYLAKDWNAKTSVRNVGVEDQPAGQVLH